MDTPVYHLDTVVKAREADLEDVVGPLDLFLHLLSKHKIAIKDIQISLILEQYLAWMDQRKSLNLEVASEFVTMASHLVYIKSRMLLSVDDEEVLSEMEQLIASLEAHQRQENYLKIQGVVPALAERYALGRDSLTRLPETLERRREYGYVHDPGELRRAMEALLERLGHKLPPPMTAFEGIVPMQWFPTLRPAVLWLQGQARSGDVILLSPGTASFDLYRGMAYRGADFKAIVAEICGL